MKKNIPKIREREGNEKIHSQNSGKGIRGFHSWEWTVTGIPAHPCYQINIFSLRITPSHLTDGSCLGLLTFISNLVHVESTLLPSSTTLLVQIPH